MSLFGEGSRPGANDVGMKPTESYMTADEQAARFGWSLVASVLHAFGGAEPAGLREPFFSNKNAPPETDFPNGHPPELP